MMILAWVLGDAFERISDSLEISFGIRIQVGSFARLFSEKSIEKLLFSFLRDHKFPRIIHKIEMLLREYIHRIDAVFRAINVSL